MFLRNFYTIVTQIPCNSFVYCRAASDIYLRCSTFLAFNILYRHLTILDLVLDRNIIYDKEKQHTTLLVQSELNGEKFYKSVLGDLYKFTTMIPFNSFVYIMEQH